MSENAVVIHAPQTPTLPAPTPSPTLAALLPGGSACPNLTAALAAARDRCQAAAKDGEVKFGTTHYSYATSEEVLATAQDALERSGLALIPIRSKLTVLSAGARSIYALDRTLLLSHTSGECVPLEVEGWPVIEEKGRPLDKAFAVALTTSLAYTMRDLLQMPRGEDMNERDDTGHTPAPILLPRPDEKGCQPEHPIDRDMQAYLRQEIERRGRGVEAYLRYVKRPSLAQVTLAEYRDTLRLFAQPQTAQVPPPAPPPPAEAPAAPEPEEEPPPDEPPGPEEEVRQRPLRTPAPGELVNEDDMELIRSYCNSEWCPLDGFLRSFDLTDLAELEAGILPIALSLLSLIHTIRKKAARWDPPISLGRILSKYPEASNLFELTQEQLLEISKKLEQPQTTKQTARQA